jgi:hypothetical protein
MPHLTLQNLYNKLGVVAMITCLTGLLFSSCYKKVDVKQVPQDAGIIDVSPTAGPKNTILSISGNNFPDKASIVVKVNGKTIPIISSTSNNIQAQIPVGTGTGKVEVTFGGNTYTGPTFTYQNTYTVTSLTNGVAGYLDGPLATAEFEDIESSAIDANDNLYPADFSGSNNVRRIDLKTGQVTTLATLTAGGGAEFLATDGAGNVYVADEVAKKIVKVTTGGVVSNLISVPFTPQGVAVGASGNVYVSGATNIAKYSAAGALLWRLTSHGTGNVDGDTSAVKFRLYGNIQVDATESKLYVVGNINTPSQIKELDMSAMKLKTIAGTASGTGFSDGDALQAEFAFIYSITLDKTGGFYIADADNGAIRYLKNGNVSTIMGGNGSGDAEGIGTAVKFGYPQHVAIDSKGNLYVSDYTNLKIYKVVVD